jgi:apolipoprotein N-acyltransferase
MLLDRLQRGAFSAWMVSLAVFALGVLHTFSFAPYEAWWLQILSMTGLAFALQRGACSVRKAAGLGWLFAFGWLLSGLWWIFISMHRFGGMHAGLAAAAIVVLAAALAIYYAGVLALWAWLRRSSPGANAVLFATLWLGAELARGTWFTGFPWIASGYAHTVGPLAAWAPWVGVYGIAWIAAFTAFVVSTLRWQPYAWRSNTMPLLIALALVCGGMALPAQHTRSSGQISVSLLQPAVPQNLKFDPNLVASHLQALSDQIAQSKGQLVVTPESVVPMSYAEVGPAYWQQLQQQLKSPDRLLLVGIFLGDEQQGYVNSMLGLRGVAAAPAVDQSSSPPLDYRYGKRHLLPFGEIIPPGFRWLVEQMNIPLGDQMRGNQTASVLLGAQRLRPLICYEDLFGEDFVDSVVGDQPATVLVNASNLAWFGRLLVQDQHQQFSQMRALEFQRPFVRSTNTGATTVIDHRGHVTARLPPEIAGLLEATVEGRTGSTPYARWLSVSGLWPAWMLCFGVVAAFMGLRRNKVAVS